VAETLTERRSAAEQAGAKHGVAEIVFFAGVAGGILIMAAILIVHLSLLNKGSWGADEYNAIGEYRDQGFSYLWFRFWSWSPRPLSESLIWLYAATVTTLHRPLIIPALSVFWLAFLASWLPAAIRCPRARLAPRILAGLAVTGFIILGQQVASVFYWPFGAVAYAPPVTIAVFLLFFLANEELRGGTGCLAISLALLAAAWSSEAGALFVVIHCTLMMIYLWWRKAPRAMLLYWVCPLLTAIPVIAAVALNGRATDNVVWAIKDPTIYHHTSASLWAALSRAGLEFTALDGSTFDRRNLLRGGLVRLLFFSGLYVCWARRGRGARHLTLLLSLSTAATMLAALAGSFRQFGEACCASHAFARQSLGTVALASLALGLPSWAPLMRRWLRALGPVALVAGALLLLNARRLELENAFDHYGDTSRAMAATWESGFAPGDSMTIFQTVPDRLFSGMLPSGYYTIDSSWWTQGVLNFFHKRTMLVLIDDAVPSP
jgi:hypothetical protein